MNVSDALSAPALTITLSSGDTKDYVLAGTIEYTVYPEGSGSPGRLDGSGLLRDGYYENPATGTILYDIEAILYGQRDRIVLSDFRAKTPEGGSVLGQGFLRLSAEEQYPFSISLDVVNAVLYRVSNVLIAVNGPSSITGTIGQAVIAGSPTAPRALVRIPPSLPLQKETLTVFETASDYDAASRSNERQDTAAFFLDADIALSSQAVHLGGRGLESTWSGSVHITGAPYAAHIVLDLTLAQGRFSFFGRPLQLTEGRIFFDGPARDVAKEARVMVFAQKQDPRMTAGLHLAGTISSAQLFIESVPAHASNEILAYVLFDRTLSRVTPAQALQLALVRDALGEETMSIPVFMDQAQQELHVERLDLLAPEDRPREIDPTTRAYVREDVYVEVEEDPGGQPGEVTVEIELTPDIYLETEAGSDIEGGIGLIYKWRY